MIKMIESKLIFFILNPTLLTVESSKKFFSNMKCILIFVIFACAFIVNSTGRTVKNWGTTSGQILRNETLIVPFQVGVVQNRNVTLTFVSY